VVQWAWGVRGRRWQRTGSARPEVSGGGDSGIVHGRMWVTVTALWAGGGNAFPAFAGGVRSGPAYWRVGAMGVSWIGVARAGLESVRRAAEIAQAEPVATDNTVSSLKRVAIP
jgi:hypothetical protein